MRSVAVRSIRLDERLRQFSYAEGTFSRVEDFDSPELVAEVKAAERKVSAIGSSRHPRRIQHEQS